MVKGVDGKGFTRPNLGNVLPRLLDAVFSPQCASCHALVASHGQLCADCWSDASFITAPFCATCDVPFEFEQGAGTVCLACLEHPPSYRRARAPMAYDDIARKLVLSFKHGDRLDPAAAYMRLMMRVGQPLLADADLVVPVPLHWSRLLKRRYNQSAILAQLLAKEAGKAYAPEVLIRQRRTPSQASLDRAHRRNNVKGAFVVPVKYGLRVKGKAVLLVDDVLTTGATVENCAQTLYKAGATTVDVLTLARVRHPGAEAG
jgi:ComF family protein